MSAWILIPCLVALRAEFNAVSPGRDRGADGSIGDSSHTSTSDHTPDEDSDVLRDHDGDSKNEVHALDIDSTGPWPAPGWFDRTILALVAREKAEYESPDVFGRLQYVIWNRRIASRSWGWTWRDYAGSDPHTNHAHFSARYTTAQEADTRPWGVKEDDTMTKAEFLALLRDGDVRQALSAAVLSTDGVVAAPAGSKNPDGSPNTHWAASSYLGSIYNAAVSARTYSAEARTGIAALAKTDLTDEAAIIRGVLAGLPAEQAAAIAAAVADELAGRLTS